MRVIGDLGPGEKLDILTIGAFTNVAGESSFLFYSFPHGGCESSDHQPDVLRDGTPKLVEEDKQFPE